MTKRLLDVLLSTTALAFALPLLLLAALAIRASSRGPVLYRARRAGRQGRPFTMYKLRTMHIAQEPGSSRVTTEHDPRVFPVGRFLRATKIDELPQMVNILLGQMSLVGPRPEDADLVARHYAPAHWETLRTRPGLTSPGSLYHDTHGGPLMGDPRAPIHPEVRYLECVLPIKLALDTVYVRHASVWYDLRLMGRTVAIIAGKLSGRHAFAEPPELPIARKLVAPARFVPGPAPVVRDLAAIGAGAMNGRTAR